MPTHISSGICKNQQIVFMGWIACNRRGYYCSELFVYHCRVMARLLLHVMARLPLQGNGTFTIACNGTVTIACNRTVTFGCNRTVTIACNRTVTPGGYLPWGARTGPTYWGGVNMGPYGPRGERGVPLTGGCTWGSHPPGGVTPGCVKWVVG